jgi:hypothetical protein
MIACDISKYGVTACVIHALLYKNFYVADGLYSQATGKFNVFFNPFVFLKKGEPRGSPF